MADIKFLRWATMKRQNAYRRYCIAKIVENKIFMHIFLLFVLLSAFLCGCNHQEGKFKEQEITVTVIDSNDNSCGNHMGGFEAMYQGRKIAITFIHGKVLTDLALCNAPGQKLSFINRSLNVFGKWRGKSLTEFYADEIYLAGAKRKAWPKIPGKIEYRISAKLSKNNDQIKVYLNDREVIFRDTKLEKDTNRFAEPKRFDALNHYEIKSGNRIIVDQGLEKIGIDILMEGPLKGVWNGSETELIASKPGQAFLILIYSETNNRFRDYYIPFVIKQ